MSGDELGRTAPRGADRVQPRLGRRFGRWLAGPSALELHVGLFVVAATALVMLNLALAPDQFAVWRPLLWWAAGVGLHTVWVAIDGIRRMNRPRPAAAGWLATAEAVVDPARRPGTDRATMSRRFGLASHRARSAIVAGWFQAGDALAQVRRTSHDAWRGARALAGWEATGRPNGEGTPLGLRVGDRLAAPPAGDGGEMPLVGALLFRLREFAVARTTSDPVRQTDWSPAGNVAEPTGRFAATGWSWPTEPPAEATWETTFVSEATLALWASPTVSPATRWNVAAEPASWSNPPATDRPLASEQWSATPSTPLVAPVVIADGRDVVLDAPRSMDGENQDWTRMEAAATAWLTQRQRTIADEPLLNMADHPLSFSDASQD